MNLKKLTLALLMPPAAAFASPVFDTITSLWYTAQHSNALVIAESRIASNQNDVAGWLIKASYDYIYADASTQSNSLDRALAASSQVTSSAFIKARLTLSNDVAGIKRWLSHETAEEHAETIEKESRPGLLPHYFRQLKALDDDGYFDNH